MEGVDFSPPTESPVTPYRLQSCTDEELMEQLRIGQADALAVLFDRHYRLVFSVALRILHDHGEAEDLMQEVFLEIYRKVEAYDPDKGNAKTWILQYAYHRSLNRQKYLSVRNFYDGRQDSDLMQWELPQSPNGWNGLSYNDWAQVLEKAMSSLSEKERRILDLAYFQGLPLKEIAAQIREPLGNVRNHYYRGLKKLRDFLQERSCLKKKPA
jgi:RNA polymerase sigma-70 factor, ECF subfamily